MQATTLYAGDAFSVFLYRCTAGPADPPFTEVHAVHSLSYVRAGTFGCRTLGAEHQLVAGSVLVGRPGQEYMATHEHHGCGDECVSVTLSPALADEIGMARLGELAALPPLAEVMVAAELGAEGALRVVEEGLKADSANVDLLTWAGVFAAQAAFKAEKTPDGKLSPAGKTLLQTAYNYYKKLFDLKNGDIEASLIPQMMTALNILERYPEANAALLELLLANPQRVLSKAVIHDKLYAFEQDIDSNALEVHVHHLRRKIDAKLVRTVRGVGYALGAAEALAGEAR